MRRNHQIVNQNNQNYIQLWQTINRELKPQFSELKQKYSTLEVENDELKQKVQLLETQVSLLKKQFDQLKSQHDNMAIETNHTQKEIIEIHDKLKSFQLTDVKDKYQGQEKKIIKAQAIVRGFFARKNYPKLKEAHEIEVKNKLTEAISKFISVGNYDASFELSKAAKSNDWHKVAQIIRGIPEQEFKLKDGKVLKY